MEAMNKAAATLSMVIFILFLKIETSSARGGGYTSHKVRDFVAKNWLYWISRDFFCDFFSCCHRTTRAKLATHTIFTVTIFKKIALSPSQPEKAIASAWGNGFCQIELSEGSVNRDPSLWGEFLPLWGRIYGNYRMSRAVSFWGHISRTVECFLKWLDIFNPILDVQSLCRTPFSNFKTNNQSIDQSLGSFKSTSWFEGKCGFEEKWP